MFEMGFDNVIEIPKSRFDWKTFYNQDFSVGGSCNSKWGSFIDCISEFDANFFSHLSAGGCVFGSAAQNCTGTYVGSI